MRKLIFNSANEDVLNVYYDAITKHDDSGGVAGLRKISKILDLFDEIATLGDVNGRDMYTLKNQEKESSLFLEEEQFAYIKSCFDKVKWHPMKARLITKAYAYLEAIPEAKIEATKSPNATGKDTK